MKSKNILDEISDAPELDWDYHMPFDGFYKYLQEKNLQNYSLIIDKEGESEEESKTLKSAREIGLENSDEADSMEHSGLRMADMMAGIISKLLKGLCDSLRYQSLDESTNKKILDVGWFCLSEVQYIVLFANGNQLGTNRTLAFILIIWLYSMLCLIL